MFSVIILWIIAADFYTYYYQEFNGRVTGKQKIQPKEAEELLINETNDAFPLWKWDRSIYEEVNVGDSIVKRRYESRVHYYKRINDSTFIEKILNM